MHKKLITACMALAAFAAFAVMPATASATNSPEVTFPTGTTLATGSPITATNVGETTFTSSFTDVHCSSATMTGKIHKNETGTVEGTIEEAHFTGTDTGSDCTSESGPVNVIENPATNGLHWCLRSTSTMATDEFQVRGGACTAASRPIRFELEFTSLGIKCGFERSTAISGTYTTHPEDAVLTISEVSFSKVSGSFFCPGSGSLDMSFTLERETASGTDPIYISS